LQGSDQKDAPGKTPPFRLEKARGYDARKQVTRPQDLVFALASCRISSYRAMMRNERLDIKKILLFLSSIYLKRKIARFLACSVGVTMREIALTHGS
jgi:hypothetical protein